MWDKILLICRNLYFNKILPVDFIHSKNDDYLVLLSYFKNEVSGNDSLLYSIFSESHYCINLIFAHIAYDHSELISEELKIEALDIITRHSNSTISDTLAKSETEWLGNQGISGGDIEAGA